MEENHGSKWYISGHRPWPVKSASHGEAWYLNGDKLVGPLACSPINSEFPDANQHNNQPQPLRLHILRPNAQSKNVERKQKRANIAYQCQVLESALPNECESIEIFQRV
jgi:hypothetical protein